MGQLGVRSLGFSRIGQFPMARFKQGPIMFYFLNWYFVPLSSFIFFGFFAFSEEATAAYKARWESIVTLCSKSGLAVQQCVFLPALS